MLDADRRRDYCRSIFDGRTRDPSTSPGVEHVRIAGPRPRFVPRFSTRSVVVCSSDVTVARERSIRTALRSQPAQIRPCRPRRNRHAVAATRRPVSMHEESHLVRPIPKREAQPHRHSEWAGVSWSKDDLERGANGGVGLALAQGANAIVAMARMRRCARSFARWRDRPHASASSRN